MKNLRCGILVLLFFFYQGCQKEDIKSIPIVSTSPVLDISANTARSGGSISSDGGSSITARGVVWSTTTTPTTSLSTKTADGTGLGTFTSSLIGLATATKYFVRAYATNSVGTSYGEEKTFVTAAALPSLSTTTISDITTTSASGGGNVQNDGGSSITARGIVWGTSTGPTTSLATKTTDGSGIGNFTSSITGLSVATKYYVRAYSTNSIGTSYGDEKNFTTLANLPSLTTTPIENISSVSATSGGNISTKSTCYRFCF